MTPEEFTGDLRRRVEQRCRRLAKQIIIRWEPHSDGFGFGHKTVVPLKDGGFFVLCEHVRYRRVPRARMIGGGLWITEFGYTLVRYDKSFVRFDFDLSKHRDIPSAPYHKHDNGKTALPLETKDPRGLDAFLAWALQARTVRRRKPRK